MPKGKQWTVEEEKQLREMAEAGNSLNDISVKLGKTPEAVRVKLRRLGLEVVDHNLRLRSTTTTAILPENLISLEEALKMLSGALKAACQPGLTKVEVQRLQVVAALARIYCDKLPDFLRVRDVEKRLFELEAKYAENAGKAAKGNGSA